LSYQPLGIFDEMEIDGSFVEVDQEYVNVPPENSNDSGEPYSIISKVLKFIDFKSV
jgi:hypothetical protein